MRKKNIIWKSTIAIPFIIISPIVSGQNIQNEQQAPDSIFITKHGPKTTDPGKKIEYTIGLKAKAVYGEAMAENFSVTDPLPLNVTYINSDGQYNTLTRTVTFNNINLARGDSLTYKVKVKVNNNTLFPDSVYLDDPVTKPYITDKWRTKNGDSLAWIAIDVGIIFYYCNDASVKDNAKLVTSDKYFIPGAKTTFSFFHEFSNDDFHNGGVVEITTDSGKTWQDLGPYMEPGGLVYTETITGNSLLKGRKAFSGSGNGTTTIDLSVFAGKAVKIRFVYATSDGSVSLPNGGSGWAINDILLSASPSVTNTAWLYNRKGELQGYSTVETKIGGKSPGTDFIVMKRNASEAIFTFQQPGKVSGTYHVKRSDDYGLILKTIGAVNAKDGDDEVQSYDFSDTSSDEGINFISHQHTCSTGTVDYPLAKAVMFNKAIRIYPISGQQIELNLPLLSSVAYYHNVIRTGGTSKHKIVIE